MRLLMVLTTLLLSVPAFAQEVEGASASLDEAARIIFEEGNRAFEAGDFATALARFENAHELSGRAQLLYNIAVSHDRLEHKEEAIEYYERYVEEAPNSARVGVARSRAAILREALTPDEEEEEVVEAPVDSYVGPPLAGPITSFALAGVGFVTFAVAGGIARGRHSTAEEGCGASATCDQSTIDDIERPALIADIGLGLGIAAAATGIIWLVVGKRRARARVDPMVGTESAGLQLSGAF